MLVQRCEKSADFIHLPPARSEFDEASPAIVVQALALSRLVVATLLFSPLALVTDPPEASQVIVVSSSIIIE
jgi:hypothetical protein